MACVAQIYRIPPHFRPSDAIADTFFGPAGSETTKKNDPHVQDLFSGGPLSR